MAGVVSRLFTHACAYDGVILYALKINNLAAEYRNKIELEQILLRYYSPM